MGPDYKYMYGLGRSACAHPPRGRSRAAGGGGGGGAAFYNAQTRAAGGRTRPVRAGGGRGRAARAPTRWTGSSSAHGRIAAERCEARGATARARACVETRGPRAVSGRATRCDATRGVQHRRAGGGRGTDGVSMASQASGGVGVADGCMQRRVQSVSERESGEQRADAETRRGVGVGRLR